MNIDQLQIPYKEFCKNSIIHIADLCNKDNSLMSFAEFQEMYTGNINFLQFSGLIATIKKHKQQNNKTIIKDLILDTPPPLN